MSALTEHDRAFIKDQLPRLREEYKHNRKKQTRQIIVIGKELPSKKAKHEWFDWAAAEFPGWD